MIFDNKTIREIQFPKEQLNNVISHCLRKLNGRYLVGEAKEQQAYGLIGGKLHEGILSIGKITPLNKNARQDTGVSEHMDVAVATHAIPGGMPVCHRGWIADSEETMCAVKKFQKNSMEMIGTYHMHCTSSWHGDEARDEPTKLDAVLGRDTGLIMFIVGVIDQNRPIIRAFYEGILDREIPIVEI